MMSSLYIGASGLRVYGEGMNVVTNNLANVNTVGFKQNMMLYSDLMSQSVPSRSNAITNMSQSGMGATVGTVRTMFMQGGFEAGSAATDLAINGRGFFGVSHGDVTHYTRAGNFRFNKEGDLLDPSGWNVLGRKITNGGVAGNTTPISLDLTNNGVGYMQGKASGWIKASSQLGGITNQTNDAANPYFSLASSWDGTKEVPLASAKYSYGEPITFYDNNGTRQNATVYYDLAEVKNGTKVMEYLIAMDPSLDGSSRAGTAGAGLLMAGTLTFDSTGTPQGMTAFSPPASGNPSDLAGWGSAGFNAGIPVFSANVAGAGAQNIQFDVGLKLASVSSGYPSAQDLTAQPDALYSLGQNITRGANTTTAYGNSSGGIFFQTDGYTEGYLQNLNVTQEGVVVGRYSNNQSDELYQLTMYRFTSEAGLRQEGKNHFSATQDAGAIEEGFAKTENFGSIHEKSLEGSNVDYAREFTTMIITQRAFQMNSKVVSTSDQMLQKALEIKR